MSDYHIAQYGLTQQLIDRNDTDLRACIVNDKLDALLSDGFPICEIITTGRLSKDDLANHVILPTSKRAVQRFKRKNPLLRFDEDLSVVETAMEVLKEPAKIRANSGVSFRKLLSNPLLLPLF
jgi:hypothetical protein